MKCCDIKSADLRELVSLQSQVKTNIGGGATEISYAEFASVRGWFVPLSGNEAMYAQRLDANTRNRLVIRYRMGITDSTRVVVRGKAYQIRFIENIEFRNKWYRIFLDGGVAT